MALLDGGGFLHRAGCSFGNIRCIGASSPFGLDWCSLFQNVMGLLIVYDERIDFDGSSDALGFAQNVSDG